MADKRQIIEEHALVENISPDRTAVNQEHVLVEDIGGGRIKVIANFAYLEVRHSLKCRIIWCSLPKASG